VRPSPAPFRKENLGSLRFPPRLGYLILARHSFRRSSSERTCVSMASCNACVPLSDNSAEAVLSRFCFQSRIACLVAVWACAAALRYVFMQASAIEHVLHSWAAAALETSKASVAARTLIAFPPVWAQRMLYLAGPVCKGGGRRFTRMNPPPDSLRDVSGLAGVAIGAAHQMVHVPAIPPI